MHIHIIDQFNRSINSIVSYVYNNCFVCSAPHPSSRLGKLFPWHISSCRLASRARFTLCARFVQRAWTLAYLALPPSLVSEDAVLLRFSDTLAAAPSEGSHCRGRRSWLEVSGVPSFPPQTDSLRRTLSYVMTLQGITDCLSGGQKKSSIVRVTHISHLNPADDP